MFEKINHGYLFIALLVITLCSLIFNWETTVLLAMATFSYGSYLILVKAYEHGRKIEPEDDVAGNTNISKKFIDHM